MEFSDFTFTWEDAEARCSRQGQILVPGRRYRAKLLKRWMEKKNVQSIWLNGWRTVSDTVPGKNIVRNFGLNFHIHGPLSKIIEQAVEVSSCFLYR